MKKTLIAAAVSAALAVPAIAQADVTLYGKFEGSLDYLNTASNTTVNGTYYGVTNGTSTNQSLSGLNLNSSRWGIKGSEDLGDGLRAIFQVESTITAEGKAKLGNRNTFVGLSGGWGTVIAGRHDTPMKALGRSVDLFGDQIGDSRDLISGTKYLPGNGSINKTAGFDLRTPQTVAYVTPSMGGFKAVGAYAMAGGVNNGAAYSLLGQYSMGPMMVGLAYESHGKGLYSGATKSETGIRLAGSYKVGALKFVGLYEQLSHLGGVENVTYSNGQTDKANVNVYGLGVAYTMGSNVLKTQVYQSNPDGSNNNSTMWAVGAEHHFSKKVMAFVDYAVMNNQNLAGAAPWYGGKEYGSYVGQNSGAASYTVAPGKNPSAVSTGLMVSF
ncbi:hypothetical protein BJI67_14115 [Acidihalobacter aeolianus]|uniref:Porin domain-containing protein n=1 Tax=Acidihalobacter aeolianus TaxID=2792603 RepID=A0A1D8KAS1_9GAMM|nr:porin [Acidihalobacter aeolianus]AOV18045.1 hypothetical protein BJI67_14115 [Acidihalobacter aeolianus]